jgi:hypothetical protein
VVQVLQVTIERKIAAAMFMDDETWLRHANPWSVAMRNTVLPLIIVAIWSRVWLGRWSLIPIGVAVLWSWLNPRVFGRPRSTGNWASFGVYGERVWLNRDRIPVPRHHRTVPHILNGVTAIGTIFTVYGVIELSLWPTAFGAALIYCGKLWFLDRMAWLYRDMCGLHEEYRSWLVAGAAPE